MPRLNVTPQIAASAGANTAPQASQADGHMFTNTGMEQVILKNTTAAPVNVTFITPRTVDGLAVPDRVVAVPATTGEVLVGHLDTLTYNQPAGTTDAGKVYVDFGTVAAGITATYIQ